MIAGDEGKPMSILERISDEPCDVEPFIDYLLSHWRGYLEATWGGGRLDEEPCKIGSVTINIGHFIMQLEDIKRKMHRPLFASDRAVKEPATKEVHDDDVLTRVHPMDQVTHSPTASSNEVE